tara:strand:- start:134 stop:781 length:648 start_codon:yes stop_codon:yes gene_type:complete
MSIQNIINKAQQIEFDRRRMVGQSISRSQRIKTAERSTGQPWKFKVTPPAQLPWTASRAFIEVIDFNDRVNEYTISLNDNSGMNYITAYQGQMTQIQLNDLTISTSTTSTLVLTTLPAISSSTVMFRAGDLIQPENSRYPYSVTTTVLRGSSSTVSVPLHRSIIASEGVNLMTQGVKVGNSATWQVIVTGLPTYALIPMRQVQYTGDFELIEKII